MTFLIDYENVLNSGIKGAEDLTKLDNVIIFLKENNTFKAETHIKLEKAVAQKSYYFVDSMTTNALDFQLIAYLGILCSEKPKERYRIVSKDHGYDAAINFLKNMGYDVERNLDLVKEFVFSEVKKLLPDFQDEECIKVSDIIKKCKTKESINNNLIKNFGTSKTGLIYKKIKPLLYDKK